MGKIDGLPVRRLVTLWLSVVVLGASSCRQEAPSRSGGADPRGWGPRAVIKGAPSPRAHRISPHETATFQVDKASVVVTYGRPSKRGRTIFGALVPYDQVWMPGADEATILSSDSPLQFASAVLPAGSYSLYTLPADTDWTLIVNRQTGQWHTTYNPSRDLMRIHMERERLAEPVEQLTIAIVPRAGGGTLRIEWDTVAVSAPFLVRH
ncbi:MAG TPA: DUF2911 domain-containing protein [Vicinamibacterales bacterium]|jgi:hypothetical protein|nr:DUF2911 domain-containing protein [Vicinamibacterales bacterium]